LSDVITPAPAGDQQIPEDFTAFQNYRAQQSRQADADEVVETPSEDAPDASETAAESDTEEEKTEEQPEKEEAEDEKAEDSKPVKKKGGWQRRIDQLTREKHELEARLASLATKPAETKPAKAETKADDGEPQIGDFETYDAYTRALARHEARQLIDEQMKHLREAEEKAVREYAQKREAEQWDAKLAEARTRYKDFDDIAFDPDVPVTPAMAEVIRDSDKGADLAYWLGQHPERAAEIAKLTKATAIAREFGKIEAELAQPAPVVKKPKISAAPEPIKPVGSKAATSKAPADMDFMEYERYRRNGGGKARFGR
jgi:hypothetical protein